jgi:hypothetical protein
MVGVFSKKQQPLLLLKTIFEEENEISKLRTDRLETCKFFADFTRQQSRTPKLHENKERTGNEDQKRGNN